MKREKNLTNKIYKKSTIEKIDRKIKLLGVSNKVKLHRFLSSRLILCFIIISVLVFVPYGIFYGPIFATIVWFGYEYLQFDLEIKKRESRLNQQALFFFQVLIMTLESGRNLENALKLTSENVKSELSREFKRALNEIQVGKNLNEVLESLKERIPSSNINSIILNIIQANNFGNSISDSLNIQLNYLRESKMLYAKAKLNKLPLKVSTVSVLFLIPLTLILIIVPIILNSSIETTKDEDHLSSSILNHQK